MTITPENNDGWDRCPTGELRRIAGESTLRRQRSERRDFAARAATACALLVACGVVVFWSLQQPTYGGLTCSECQGLMPAFSKFAAAKHDAGADSGASAADRALFAQVQEHLRLCKRCHALFSAHYPNLTACWIPIGQPSIVFTANAQASAVAAAVPML